MPADEKSLPNPQVPRRVDRSLFGVERGMELKFPSSLRDIGQGVEGYEEPPPPKPPAPAESSASPKPPAPPVDIVQGFNALKKRLDYLDQYADRSKEFNDKLAAVKMEGKRCRNKLDELRQAREKKDVSEQKGEDSYTLGVQAEKALLAEIGELNRERAALRNILEAQQRNYARMADQKFWQDRASVAAEYKKLQVQGDHLVEISIDTQFDKLGLAALIEKAKKLKTSNEVDKTQKLKVLENLIKIRQLEQEWISHGRFADYTSEELLKFYQDDIQQRKVVLEDLEQALHKRFEGRPKEKDYELGLEQINKRREELQKLEEQVLASMFARLEVANEYDELQLDELSLTYYNRLPTEAGVKPISLATDVKLEIGKQYKCNLHFMPSEPADNKLVVQGDLYLYEKDGKIWYAVNTYEAVIVRAQIEDSHQEVLTALKKNFVLLNSSPEAKLDDQNKVALLNIVAKKGHIQKVKPVKPRKGLTPKLIEEFRQCIQNAAMQHEVVVAPESSKKLTKKKKKIAEMKAKGAKNREQIREKWSIENNYSVTTDPVSLYEKMTQLEMVRLPESFVFQYKTPSQIEKMKGNELKDYEAQRKLLYNSSILYALNTLPEKLKNFSHGKFSPDQQKARDEFTFDNLSDKGRVLWLESTRLSLEKAKSELYDWKQANPKPSKQLTRMQAQIEEKLDNLSNSFEKVQKQEADFIKQKSKEKIDDFFKKDSLTDDDVNQLYDQLYRAELFIKKAYGNDYNPELDVMEKLAAEIEDHLEKNNYDSDFKEKAVLILARFHPEAKKDEPLDDDRLEELRNKLENMENEYNPYKSGGLKEDKGSFIDRVLYLLRPKQKLSEISLLREAKRQTEVFRPQNSWINIQISTVNKNTFKGPAVLSEFFNSLKVTDERYKYFKNDARQKRLDDINTLGKFVDYYQDKKVELSGDFSLEAPLQAINLLHMKIESEIDDMKAQSYGFGHDKAKAMQRAWMDELTRLQQSLNAKKTGIIDNMLSGENLKNYIFTKGKIELSKLNAVTSFIEDHLETNQRDQINQRLANIVKDAVILECKNFLAEEKPGKCSYTRWNSFANFLLKNNAYYPALQELKESFENALQKYDGQSPALGNLIVALFSQVDKSDLKYDNFNPCAEYVKKRFEYVIKNVEIRLSKDDEFFLNIIQHNRGFIKEGFIEEFNKVVGKFITESDQDWSIETAQFIEKYADDKNVYSYRIKAIKDILSDAEGLEQTFLGDGKNTESSLKHFAKESVTDILTCVDSNRNPPLDIPPLVPPGSDYATSLAQVIQSYLEEKAPWTYTANAVIESFATKEQEQQWHLNWALQVLQGSPKDFVVVELNNKLKEFNGDIEKYIDFFGKDNLLILYNQISSSHDDYFKQAIAPIRLDLLSAQPGHVLEPQDEKSQSSILRMGGVGGDLYNLFSNVAVAEKLKVVPLATKLAENQTRMLVSARNFNVAIKDFYVRLKNDPRAAADLLKMDNEIFAKSRQERDAPAKASHNKYIINLSLNSLLEKMHLVDPEIRKEWTKELKTLLEKEDSAGVMAHFKKIKDFQLSEVVIESIDDTDLDFQFSLAASFLKSSNELPRFAAELKDISSITITMDRTNTGIYDYEYTESPHIFYTHYKNPTIELCRAELKEFAREAAIAMKDERSLVKFYKNFQIWLDQDLISSATDLPVKLVGSYVEIIEKFIPADQNELKEMLNKLATQGPDSFNFDELRRLSTQLDNLKLENSLEPNVKEAYKTTQLYVATALNAAELKHEARLLQKQMLLQHASIYIAKLLIASDSPQKVSIPDILRNAKHGNVLDVMSQEEKDKYEALVLVLMDKYQEAEQKKEKLKCNVYSSSEGLRYLVDLFGSEEQKNFCIRVLGNKFIDDIMLCFPTPPKSSIDELMNVAACLKTHAVDKAYLQAIDASMRMSSRSDSKSAFELLGKKLAEGIIDYVNRLGDFQKNDFREKFIEVFKVRLRESKGESDESLKGIREIVSSIIKNDFKDKALSNVSLDEAVNRYVKFIEISEKINKKEPLDQDSILDYITNYEILNKNNLLQESDKANIIKISIPLLLQEANKVMLIDEKKSDDNTILLDSLIMSVNIDKNKFNQQLNQLSFDEKRILWKVCAARLSLKSVTNYNEYASVVHNLTDLMLEKCDSAQLKLVQEMIGEAKPIQKKAGTQATFQPPPDEVTNAVECVRAKMIMQRIEDFVIGIIGNDSAMLNLFKEKAKQLNGDQKNVFEERSNSSCESLGGDLNIKDSFDRRRVYALMEIYNKAEKALNSGKLADVNLILQEVNEDLKKNAQHYSVPKLVFGRASFSGALKEFAETLKGNSENVRQQWKQEAKEAREQQINRWRV